MSDLVARLRALYVWMGQRDALPSDRETIREVADALEALEKENARLCKSAEVWCGQAQDFQDALTNEHAAFSSLRAEVLEAIGDVTPLLAAEDWVRISKDDYGRIAALHARLSHPAG